MKKLVLFIMIMTFCLFDTMVYTEDYSYIEIIEKTDVPDGTYIGTYMFQKGTLENSIRVSNGTVDKNIVFDNNVDDYTIFYEGNMYLFINKTLDLIPDNNLSGAIRYNSPIYFYDCNMNLISKKEFDGYMKYEKFENGYFYFSFIDASFRYYNESTESFEGELINHYYRTDNGINFEEIQYDDFYTPQTDKFTNKLLTGNEYYFDSDNTLFLKSDITTEVLREQDSYNRYSATTNSGNILYKKLYDENSDEITQKISFDAINYYSIPLDADLSNSKCDNCYFYCDIIGVSDKCYRIKISNLIDDIKIMYDNKYLSFETIPTVENDRTLVPMRFLFETMGADVEWHDETRTATVNRENEIISFSIDDTAAVVNSEVKTMDVPARLINGKTMIPIRFLSEELGFQVEWDEENRVVTIK